MDKTTPLHDYLRGAWQEGRSIGDTIIGARKTLGKTLEFEQVRIAFTYFGETYA